MKYRCRCSRKACQARRTLNKHPDDYKRKPKCKFCGNDNWYVDNWRHRNELHKYCWCRGLGFPHRAGSKGCVDHPDYCPF